MRTGPNRLHGSAAEELLALHLRGLAITGWVPEYRFDTQRRYRWDFAWPSKMLAVEVQGGIWRRRGGAHTGTGAVRDAEKLSLGAILGWRVLVVTTDHVRSGEAVRWIQQALGHGDGTTLAQETRSASPATTGITQGPRVPQRRTGGTVTQIAGRPSEADRSGTVSGEARAAAPVRDEVMR